MAARGEKLPNLSRPNVLVRTLAQLDTLVSFISGAPKQVTSSLTITFHDTSTMMHYPPTHPPTTILITFPPALRCACQGALSPAAAAEARRAGAPRLVFILTLAFFAARLVLNGNLRVLVTYFVWGEPSGVAVPTGGLQRDAESSFDDAREF